MTHVWFDDLGRAHRSSVAAEAVDDALRSIEDALELVEAISVIVRRRSVTLIIFRIESVTWSAYRITLPLMLRAARPAI